MKYVLNKFFDFPVRFRNYIWKNCSHYLKLRINFVSLNSAAAPGSYDVEKADKKIHESSPAFSLGVKYKEPKQENIPGNECIFCICGWYHIFILRILSVEII